MAGPTGRTQLVQFLHTINVLVMTALGLGALFFTNSIVPGVTLDTKAGIRSFGAFSLVYALLLSSLGPLHHGAYCLTMTLHFILMSVNVLDMNERKLQDGSVQPQLALQSGFNGIMFAIMLGILINGGIHSDARDGVKKNH